MNTSPLDLPKRPTLRHLLLLFAAGTLGTGTAVANQWINADEDHLWSNENNWTAGIPDSGLAWINGTTDEARIDYEAPDITEAIIGQGASDGSVRMQEGGSLTSSHINLAFGDGWNGTWNHDAGTLNAGDLRLGRQDGGTAEFNLSGGTVNATGLRLNSTSGTDGEDQATGIANVTGGALNLDNHLRLNSRASGATTAQTVTVSGGTVTSSRDLQIGRGDMEGGTATVNLSETGSLSVGNIEMATSGSGGTGASTLNVSGGTLDASGNLRIGHEGSDADVEISGGTVTIENQTRIGNVGTGTTANGSLTVTGGNVTLKALTAVGTVGEDMGRGSITIGGDANFTFGESNASIVLREGVGNSFTVNGSQATINSLRAAGTALEFNNGNDVNLNFDSGGISTVDLTADIRFGGDDVTLNIDATEASEGVYALFTFNDYWDTGHTTFGTENLDFAAGMDGWINYNANDISLEIIPEPSTYALLFGAGIFGIVLLLRSRRRNRL